MSVSLRGLTAKASLAAFAAGLLAGLVAGSWAPEPGVESARVPGAAEAGGEVAALPSASDSWDSESLLSAADARAMSTGPGACGTAPQKTPAAAGEQCGAEEVADPQELRRLLLLESGALAGTLGAPRTGIRALLQKLPVMPGGRGVAPLGEQLEAHGVPMNVVAYEIDREASAILEFYARHFEERGWSWLGLEETGRMVPYPAISATEPAEEIQLSVMVMEYGEGRGSTVVLTLADMMPEAQATTDELGDLPRYPETRPLAVRSMDQETQSLTVSFRTPDARERVIDFYREQFSLRGYRELSAEGAGGGEMTTLRFAGSGRHWSLHVSTHENATAVTALTSLEEVLP